MSGIRVHVYTVGGEQVAEAWEPIDGPTAGHTTISSTIIPSGWHGLVTSRPLPAHIEAMPTGSPERIAAVVDFQAGLVLEAFGAIAAAIPGVLMRGDARLDGGRIRVPAKSEPLVVIA